MTKMKELFVAIRRAVITRTKNEKPIIQMCVGKNLCCLYCVEILPEIIIYVFLTKPFT